MQLLDYVAAFFGGDEGKQAPEADIKELQAKIDQLTMKIKFLAKVFVH